MQLKVSLFGTPKFERDGRPYSIGRRKVIALLAFLAHGGQPYTRESLATLLWPEHDQSGALKNLRRELGRLKEFVGDSYLDADRMQIGLRTGGAFQVDTAVFQAHLQTVENHNHPPEAVCSECTTVLAEAVTLYTGDFMSGFNLPDCPEFDEWQFFEREALRQKLGETLQKLIHWHRTANEFDKGIEYGRRWLSLDSLHEPAHRELMQLYAWAGQHSAAIRQYETCLQLLQEELGVEPAPETSQIYEAIKRRDFASPTPPEPVVFTLRQPVLPTPATPFVGRQQELAEIVQLLTTQPECRLLTIVGTGGIGKTRLALSVAKQMQADFNNAVYFVPLAALTTQEDVPIAIAEAMSIRLSGSQDPEQQLLQALQDKTALLVIDNFEHLLSGVPLLVKLLERASGIKILATSRERLNLVGEQLYTLHGLEIPETETAVSPESHSAITLFLQHVNLVRPSTAVQPDEWPEIVRICQLVQGMPLALLLAAGWASMLSFAEIRQEIGQSVDFLETELKDLPQRQRSIRAIFNATWKRLTAEEASVLPKLSLFSGGFTREAAQNICGANLKVLRQLTDRSIITVDDQQRYWIHELLRQYSIEQLPPAATEQLYGRFAAYFANFMQQQLYDIQRAAYQRALDKIVSEQGNLTQAWEWLITAVTSQPATEEILNYLPPFIESWQFYYYLKGPMSTALDFFLDELRVLETAVSQPAIKDAPTANLYQTMIANLQTKAAYFSFGLGHYQQVDELLAQAIPWLEETENRSLLAFAYNCWAKASVLRGQRDLAQEQLLKALGYAQLPQDYFIQADALKVLGVVAVDAGEYELAHARYQESLALFREQNFAPGLTMLLHNIGTAYSRQEETELALEAYQEALGYAREAGFTRLEMECIGAMGGAYRTLGEFKKSESHLLRSIALAKQIGENRVLASLSKNLGITYLDVGDVLKAKKTLKSALSLSWATETVPDALSILSAYARAVASQGQLENALAILLFVKTEDRIRQIDVDNNQPIIDELTAELPPEFVSRAEQSAAMFTLPELVSQII
ncbi:tetratricopeptide repeat protein [Candidatus Leptofilum sp.]|uniref:tetratricopeptide repeat protein n=1 Tax=Candidatus Leptofilum sp. TaxID=3241576 RepID=UPI003B597A00